MKEIKTKFPNMEKMYKPVDGSVLIRIRIPLKGKGGIILLEENRVPDPFATVEAIGAGVENLKVGDRIMLKAEEHELAPSRRIVVYTVNESEHFDSYYVQIYKGAIMGIVTQEFEDLARENFKKHIEKAEANEAARDFKRSLGVNDKPNIKIVK